MSPKPEERNHPPAVVGNRTDADAAQVASGQPAVAASEQEQALVQALIQQSHHQYPSHQHLPFLTVADGSEQQLQHIPHHDPSFLPSNVGPAPAKSKKNRPPEEDGKPKTKRIFQACSKCRDRKAKCDGTRPSCTSCITRGLECEYSAERKMRGPSKKRLREDGAPLPPKRRRAQGPGAFNEQHDAQPGDPYMHDPNAPPGYVIGPGGYGEHGAHYGFPAPYPGHPYPPPPGPDGQPPMGYPMPPPHDGPPPEGLDMHGAPYPPHQYDPAVYGHPPPGYPPHYQPPYGYHPPHPIQSFQQPMQPVRANGSREPSPEQPAAPTPVGPPGVNPNYISREDFAIIMDRYLNSLSRKNREKALLTQATYNDILKLLLAGQAHEEQAQGSTADPDANRSIPGDVDIDPSLDTPQFRFWVRKMFTVQKIGDVDVVAHNDKPVAVQEQLYDILIHCHAQTSHGGRDKTSAMVNEHYSWIPKVFIDTFVKACPGCPRKISAARRAGGGGTGEGDGSGAAGEDGAHSGSSPLADDHTTSPAEVSAADQGVRRDDEAEEDEAETEVPLNYPASPGGNSREDDEKEGSKDIRGETN